MSRTLVNLVTAYLGESQARNRYTFFASKARKEGFLQISDIFLETAEQEREHGSWFYKLAVALKEKEGVSANEVNIWEADVFVAVGSTMENLKFAVEGETHEYTALYPEFARIADEEGYPEVAARFRFISNAEQHHAERYQKLYDQLDLGTLRIKEEDIERVCTQCGYVYKGKAPLKVCPACGHDETYAVVKNENY